MSDATRAISALDQRREPRNGRRRLSLGTLSPHPRTALRAYAFWPHMIL